MTRRFVIASFFFLAAACDGGPAMELGEPQIRVVGGANQQHDVAEGDSLDSPVTAQLFQSPTSSGITLRLVEEAHAQTPVVGIAGEQVCAVGIGDVPLEAWNPCAVTGTDGLAQFFFVPGTVAADSSCAEIRAVVAGQKTITDTVCASIEPGPPVGGFLLWDCQGFGTSASDTTHLEDITRRYSDNGLGDQYGNEVNWSLQTYPGDRPYQILADGRSVVARPGYSEVIDSVALVHPGGTLRPIHVYVRHSAVSGPILLFMWPAAVRDCGEGFTLPPPV